MVKDGDNYVYDTLEKSGCVWEEVALGLSWKKNVEGKITIQYLHEDLNQMSEMCKNIKQTITRNNERLVNKMPSTPLFTVSKYEGWNIETK